MVVVIDDEWGTPGIVVDMLVFLYDWYGCYLPWGVGRPYICSSMIENGRVGG